jgi:hypothetical protein
MATLNWQFPRGIGGNTSQPYMILTSYESKNAIASAPDPMSSIVLYIPPNSLKQTTDANWSGVEGGALKAGAMSAIGSITGLDKLMTGGERGVTDWGETIGNIFTSAGMGGFQAISKQFDKGTGGMLSAGAGIAVNNHMAMAYKGPDKFRTHEFAFNFFPKNKDDAKEIKMIIYDFQNGMLPRMQGTRLKANRKLSQPFFNSPRHWNIEFYNGDGTKNQVTETIEGKTELRPGFLFEIKKSVITSMTVNHDPNSTISLHADGSPVQTAFSLTFQEIELPTSEDPVASYTHTNTNSPGHPSNQGTGTQTPTPSTPGSWQADWPN